MKDIKFLDDLAQKFEKLPGVGRKTAQRYAYYIVEKMSTDEVSDFSNELIVTKEKVKNCKVCGMLTDQEVCSICSSSYRSKNQIMVVRDTKDVLAIERTNQYNGLYHTLGGLISLLDGISPDELNIASLEERVNNDEKIEEVIIATSFTPNGETTALYLEKILSKDNLTISRIGYGLPAGGDIEYVDELTLKRAIDARKKSN